MKAEFAKHFSDLADISPKIFRAMYQFLTGDHSQSQDKLSKEIDMRVKLAVRGDMEMALDLRENNGAPSKYDAFWNALQDILDKSFPSAANQRRHGDQLHMPIAISISDLMKLVEAELPQATPIPSRSWVHLQFQPKVRSSHVSLNYTGRFNIVYKVQTRSMHRDHPDAHFCVALFKYIREFSILNRKHVALFCEDDKHSVSIGEPGHALASVDRGRQVMVLGDKSTTAADHDFHTFKVIPSVIFSIDIPEKM